MHTEYAIREAGGEFWGLPIKTWDTRGAALKELDFLNARRDEMRTAAEQAEQTIPQAEKTDPSLVVGGAEGLSFWLGQLREAMERWDNEKDRSWAIVSREVGQWQP